MTVATVRRRSWFYPAMGLAIAVIVAVGFARTSYLKASLDPRPLTLRLHLHGLMLTGWIVLFLVQTGLIATTRLTAHRRLGLAGAALAALAVITTYAAAFESAAHVRGGLTSVDRLYSNLLLVTMFGLFVAAGVALRRRPDAHKRLMLLAMIAAVGPGANRAVVLLTGRPGRRLSCPADLRVGVAGSDQRLAHTRTTHSVLFWGGALLVASLLTRRSVGGSDSLGARRTLVARLIQMGYSRENSP